MPLKMGIFKVDTISSTPYNFKISAGMITELENGMNHSTNPTDSPFHLLNMLPCLFPSLHLCSHPVPSGMLPSLLPFIAMLLTLHGQLRNYLAKQRSLTIPVYGEFPSCEHVQLTKSIPLTGPLAYVLDG